MSEVNERESSRRKNEILGRIMEELEGYREGKKIGDGTMVVVPLTTK